MRPASMQRFLRDFADHTRLKEIEAEIRAENTAERDRQRPVIAAWLERVSATGPDATGSP